MTEDRNVLQWQRRMASFMTASIVAAAVFFAVVTVWQFTRLSATVPRPAVLESDVWAAPSIPPANHDQQFQLMHARAAFALERELVARRYEQANLTLTTRVWTRLMGFITGMILALVGAAFVLGKLREDASEASAKGGLPGQEWSVSMRSASPGVILATLGTVLMGLAISIQATFEVRDQAVYFGRMDPLLPESSLPSNPAIPPVLGRILRENQSTKANQRENER